MSTPPHSRVPPTPSRPTADGFVYGVATMLLLTAFYACWCGVPLIWDGAYQLVLTLIGNVPFVYLMRFHSYFAWLPVVWAERMTGNFWLLQGLFGLPFLLAPVAGILVSWWFVRKHGPGLIIWAIFGICAATLPGQIFIINDSVFQQHLFWPVFLGMMVPLNVSRRIVLGVLAIFQLSHPIGIVLLLGAGAAALIVGKVGRDRRVWPTARAICMLGLAILAAWKLHRFPDFYARSEFTWSQLWSRWHKGVTGYPLTGECFMYAAAILLFIRQRPSNAIDHRRRWLNPAALGMTLIAGAIWFFWATDGHRWYGALDYRRWVVPLTMPFYVLAFVEVCLAAAKRSQVGDPAMVVRSRVGMSWMLGAIYAVVLCTQSRVWLTISDRLMNEVHAYPQTVVPLSALPWMAHTPLDHWATEAYVICVQGRRPTRMLLDDRSRSALPDHPGSFPLTQFHFISPVPGAGGWYDLRLLMPAVEQAAGRR